MLAGRVAVVTGGTSGIGLDTVRRFLAEGASVAFCARSADAVGALEAQLNEMAPNRVLGLAADIQSTADMDRFAHAAFARFARVDVLVHNAGRSLMQSFDETSDEGWRAELELKYFGVLRPTRAFIPLLRASDAASMVYVSSLLAKQPEPKLIATSAARAGVLNLMKSLAAEYAPQVRVNSILLGLIDTGQWDRRYRQAVDTGTMTLARGEYVEQLARERAIPMGRIGKPEEVAAAIAFLSSPLCGFMTGTVVEISGGQSRYV